MKKTELFKNFINDENTFHEAKSYWINLVNNIAKEHCKEEDINQDNKFDRDANPILFKTYDSVKKSVRVIQEKFNPKETKQLGAWVELYEEPSNPMELVISVELTKETEPFVKEIIKAWFEIEPVHFHSKLDEILNEFSKMPLIDNPDIEALQHLAMDIEAQRADGQPMKDQEHYCYEAIMNAFYGNDYFKTINSN